MLFNVEKVLPLFSVADICVVVLVNIGNIVMDNPFKDHGLVSWSELMTTDFDRSFSFYKELFGWKLKEVPGREGSRYALVINENASEPFAGILSMPKAQDRGIPSHWKTYVTVDNVEETITKAKKLGAEIVLHPMKIERVGLVATIRDPQGAVISIVKYDLLCQP